MVSTPDAGGDDGGRIAGTPAGPAEPQGAHLAGGEPGPAHDAFISYSRRDAAFAARLQQALEKYTPPSGLGLERRRLRVFRDQHDFTGTDYYDAIQRHLAGARKLIVVCSPDAAASPYVGDEIERFVALHGADHVVPVLWRGVPNNESTPETAADRAFPPALARALEMPLAADFRGRDPRSRRFLEGSGEGAWMLLLANLLDVSRAEIERRELRRRRRTRRIWTTGVGAVMAALLALSAWALFEGERALARQLAAEAALSGVLDVEQVERRVLLA
ncbi:MAG TPA: toll/interleukin-1 receptor domain-containing protein, partial [Longimicrobium sp.]|nr:toll/interleukin-1 receptor domain-containing protein [Longimicrobium sp.]